MAHKLYRAFKQEVAPQLCCILVELSRRASLVARSDSCLRRWCLHPLFDRNTLVMLHDWLRDRRTVVGNIRECHAMAVDPERDMLYFGSDFQVEAIHLPSRTRSVVAEYPHVTRTTSMAIMPGGSELVVAGQYGLIQLHLVFRGNKVHVSWIERVTAGPVRCIASDAKHVLVCMAALPDMVTSYACGEMKRLVPLHITKLHLRPVKRFGFIKITLAGMCATWRCMTKPDCTVIDMQGLGTACDRHEGVPGQQSYFMLHRDGNRGDGKLYKINVGTASELVDGVVWSGRNVSAVAYHSRKQVLFTADADLCHIVVCDALVREKENK